MKKALFVGREHELELLEGLFEKRAASFVVVKGRRRIGKSRLVQEFASNHPFYQFSGLAPDKGITSETQKQHFAKSMERQFNLPPILNNDWGDLFWLLANQVRTGRAIILLDEISWMAIDDPTFLPKLKDIWDTQLKQNPELILVICGSVSIWIEENILTSTGFMGRNSLVLTINELSLEDCLEFWGKRHKAISAYEKLKMLAVTGGIPRYLEEIKPSLDANRNIQELCFMPSGILFREFDQIFSAHFAKKSEFYKKIIIALADGSKEHKDLCKKLNVDSSGLISDYLFELVEAGFIKRENSWNFKSGSVHEKQIQYRLSDNYVRFYIKYILPNKEKINSGNYIANSLSSLPGYNSIMGLQFENLVLNNRLHIKKILRINPNDIICDNPYFQRKTSKTEACQVDYLIQTKFNSLYLCEFKFSSKAVGHSVVAEMKEKVKRLTLPRNFSYRCVLIHVNGVTDEVLDSGFFSAIIDFSKFLE